MARANKFCMHHSSRSLKEIHCPHRVRLLVSFFWTDDDFYPLCSSSAKYCLYSSRLQFSCRHQKQPDASCKLSKEDVKMWLSMQDTHGLCLYFFLALTNDHLSHWLEKQQIHTVCLWKGFQTHYEKGPWAYHIFWHVATGMHAYMHMATRNSYRGPIPWASCQRAMLLYYPKHLKFRNC